MLFFICNNRHFTFARDLSRDLGEYPAFLGFSEHQALLPGGHVSLIASGVIPARQVQIHAVAKCFPRTDPHGRLKPSGGTFRWLGEVSGKGFKGAHMPLPETASFRQ